MTTVEWGREIIIVGAAIWILISSGLYNWRLFVVAIILVAFGVWRVFKDKEKGD